MRKIQKHETPFVLQQNAQRWTEEFLLAKKTGNIPDAVNYRYNRPDIKEAENRHCRVVG